MTEVLLVRHGQASFGQANYDVLSERGREQARLLAHWLGAHYDGFDHVAHGEHVRHRDTYAPVSEHFAAGARALPAPVVHRGFNEFDHEAVFRAFSHTHEHHEAVRAIAGENARKPELMLRFLRAGFASWAAGKLDDHVPESWSGFGARVREALIDTVARNAGARRILIVTSGGVMAHAVAQVLKLDPEATVDLNLSIRNSAMAQLHVQGERLSLSAWNILPHLASAEHRPLWTFY